MTRVGPIMRSVAQCVWPKHPEIWPAGFKQFVEVAEVRADQRVCERRGWHATARRRMMGHDHRGAVVRFDILPALKNGDSHYVRHPCGARGEPGSRSGFFSGSSVRGLRDQDRAEKARARRDALDARSVRGRQYPLSRGGRLCVFQRQHMARPRGRALAVGLQRGRHWRSVSRPTAALRRPPRERT